MKSEIIEQLGQVDLLSISAAVKSLPNDRKPSWRKLKAGAVLRRRVASSECHIASA
jgi:hypothetical protein